MDGLPADAPDTRAPVAVNAMPHPPDLPQLLHVDVEQLPGAALLVTDGGTLGLEPIEAIEPQPALDGHDGRDREPIVIRDPEGTPALVARPENLSALRSGHLARDALWAGRAITKPGGPVRLNPPHPLVDRSQRNARGPSDHGPCLASLHRLDERESPCVG